MKLNKYISLFLVGMFAIIAPASAVLAAAPRQDAPETPEDMIQVVLVLDVSKSMNEPILSGDLPEELLALSEQINAIQADPALTQIEEQIDEIWNDPEVVAARDDWQVTVDALNA